MTHVLGPGLAVSTPRVAHGTGAEKLLVPLLLQRRGVGLLGHDAPKQLAAVSVVSALCICALALRPFLPGSSAGVSLVCLGRVGAPPVRPLDGGFDSVVLLLQLVVL